MARTRVSAVSNQAAYSEIEFGWCGLTDVRYAATPTKFRGTTK